MHSGLTKIRIPASVQEIGPAAFQAGKFTLFEVNPNSVYFSSRDGILFDYNKSILWAYPVAAEAEFYEVPDGTETIRSYAFAGSENLKSLALPSIKTIEDSAMAECFALTQLDFGNVLINLGRAALSDCCWLTTVDLPETLEVIGPKCFEKCTLLTQIFLPNGVTKIGEQAFFDSGIVLLSILGTIRDINPSALSGCDTLAVVRIRGLVGEALCTALETSPQAEQLTIFLDANAGYSDGDVICNGAFIGHLESEWTRTPSRTLTDTPTLVVSLTPLASPGSESASLVTAPAEQSRTPVPTQSENIIPQSDTAVPTQASSGSSGGSVAVVVVVVILVLVVVGAAFWWFRRKRSGQRLKSDMSDSPPVWLL
jgi:hypothetical protein